MTPRIICFAAVLTVSLAAQSITVSTTGGMVRVRSAFGFIEGELLNRLRDGRSVRLDIELAVLGARAGGPIAQTKQSFNLSFDLWEERIAVTRLSSPPRSVSHLRPREAEAWCLDNVTVARSELGRLAADAPFWIRLSYIVPDDVSPPDADADDIFTLRRLIDVLSRRQRESGLSKMLEAGPYRLSQ